MKLATPDQIMMDGRQITPAMRQWMTTVSQELWPSPWFDVKEYGARGDGVADDTGAINAAYAAIPTTGGILFFPAGTYKVTAALTTWSKKLTAMGVGGMASVISTSHATADVVTLTGEGQRITGLKFTASVTRTDGAFIVCSACNNTLINWCKFTAYYHAIRLLDGVIIDLTALEFRDGVATTGVGIYIDGGFAYSINSILMDAAAGSMPGSGIYVVSVGDLVLYDCNIIHHGNDLSINPAASDVVAAIYATDCFFDTATRGLLINPSSTGAIVRCKFTSCWFSSHTDDGVSIGGGGSTVIDGISFVDCYMYDNGAMGLDADYCDNLKVIGGAYAGNTNQGIEISNSSNFQIIGATCGTHGGFGANNYGISVGTASADNWIIADCDLVGNTTAALFNSSTGTNWHTHGNLPTSVDSLFSSNVGTRVAGKGFVCKEGSNARMGQSVLVAGTVTPANTSITANTRIFLSRSVTGGTVGHLSSTRINATSFTINSSSATDTSTIDWLLVEPS